MDPAPDRPDQPAIPTALAGDPSSPASATARRPRRTRKPISCEPCRQSKLRCDRELPCSSCKRHGYVTSCTYSNRKPANLGLLSPSSPQSLPLNPDLDSLVDNAIANVEQERQDFTHSRWEAVLQRPIDLMDHPAQPDSFSQPGNLCFPFPLGPRMFPEEILSLLPPIDCCDYLVTQYFMRLSPFFHILHGPTFQNQYHQFVQNPSGVELSWLALLFAICSVSIHTLEYDDRILQDLWPQQLQPQLQTPPQTHDHGAASSPAQHPRSPPHPHLHYQPLRRRLGSNIAIALKTPSPSPSTSQDTITTERHRRCWAGILMLHTYQAISYRDIDTSSLLHIPAQMPADVNDTDITPTTIHPASTQPTQMSVMKYKIRLFQLSSRICRHLSPSNPNPDPNPSSPITTPTLHALDTEILAEQTHWSTTFLHNNAPSILETSSYAHWCILQLYAHQLYLLLHRPFCRRGRRFSAASKQKCLESGAALVDIQRRFLELPRLRHYRWYVYGMTEAFAVHGAVALAACLLDGEGDGVAMGYYRDMLEGGVCRIEGLRDRSSICGEATPGLRYLVTMLSPERYEGSGGGEGAGVGSSFDDWVDALQWLNPDSVNWDFRDGVLGG
ncbi:hypothetical protein BO71DRAFT_435548 [Aspergillus ellipticus CBS 707.79]|uniref:Zn(2)-C6 fungal-type domain-containing protein n=1 Tax=Aspergillus ellipticus CBS 707.79 TaxID=1448320 RepID=A0A319DKR8_9EURO|nr:hypothetical protein BO71DRAFT_435548 [Aspergillus ellipticus CBS 707.79]